MSGDLGKSWAECSIHPRCSWLLTTTTEWSPFTLSSFLRYAPPHQFFFYRTCTNNLHIAEVVTKHFLPILVCINTRLIALNFNSCADSSVYTLHQRDEDRSNKSDHCSHWPKSWTWSWSTHSKDGGFQWSLCSPSYVDEHSRIHSKSLLHF